MGKRIWVAAVGAAALAAGLWPATEAGAQGSDRARRMTVPIRMARGQVCFRHDGVGTNFVGDFRRGQRIVATSTGDQLNGDANSEWTTTLPRHVEAHWGHDQSHEFNEGDAFIAPVSGRYSFDFYPMSAVGGRGVFIVCAF